MKCLKPSIYCLKDQLPWINQPNDNLQCRKKRERNSNPAMQLNTVKRFRKIKYNGLQRYNIYAVGEQNSLRWLSRNFLSGTAKLLQLSRITKAGGRYSAIPNCLNAHVVCSYLLHRVNFQIQCMLYCCGQVIYSLKTRSLPQR